MTFYTNKIYIRETFDLLINAYFTVYETQIGFSPEFLFFCENILYLV